jgi:hypothetical protein
MGMSMGQSHEMICILPSSLSQSRNFLRFFVPLPVLAPINYSGVARAAVVVFALSVAAGCQAIPGDGPWMNDASSRSTEALPFAVSDLTPTTVVA